MTQAPENNKITAELDKIYYDPLLPGSYGGINALYRNVKTVLPLISKENVKSYLSRQRAYTIHKPIRHKFERNKTYVSGIDRQWQADLADMKSISKFNNGVTFILTVIDVFSKYAWVVPVKNKGTNEVLNAFENIIKEAHPRKPDKLQTDQGKEFVNKNFQKWLKTKKIKFFYTFSDKKASIVERFNRTLKTRIFRYLSANHTFRYIDILKKLVLSYNQSYHRSIGMRPIDVNLKNETRVWRKLYNEGTVKHQKRSIPQNTLVRITRKKKDFEKGYMPNWTDEHFIVDKNERTGVRVYKLKDEQGEPIEGIFYKDEVQPIQQNEFLVEKILKERKGPKKSTLYFIKWKGWPTKFNTWVNKKNLINGEYTRGIRLPSDK